MVHCGGCAGGPCFCGFSSGDCCGGGHCDGGHGGPIGSRRPVNGLTEDVIV